MELIRNGARQEFHTCECFELHSHKYAREEIEYILSLIEKESVRFSATDIVAEYSTGGCDMKGYVAIYVEEKDDTQEWDEVLELFVMKAREYNALSFERAINLAQPNPA